MNEPHKRIWLQWHDDEVCWCLHKVNDNDVEYVRADLAQRPEATTPAHTDHPARHFDRTCPACIATALDDASEKLALAAEYEAGTEELLRRIKESRHWAEEGQKWGYLLDEATHDLIQGPQSMNKERS